MKDRLDAQGPFPAVAEEVAEPIALVLVVIVVIVATPYMIAAGVTFALLAQCFFVLASAA